jgi:predicted DNA-binding transcriptional regulator AlpA
MPKLRRPDAAKYLSVSPRTLAKWATVGGSPPYFRLGGVVVYDTADLDAWMAERRQANTPGERAD